MIDRALAAMRRSPQLTIWYLFLLGMITIGLVAGVQVLLNGLRVTNLTDELPWGLWIVVDLSSIALGAGAFTLSAAVALTYYVPAAESRAHRLTKAGAPV